MIRYRISELSHQDDIWFILNHASSIDELITSMHQNIYEHILPFFKKTNSKAELIQYLDGHDLPYGTHLAKLISYTACGELAKAQNEYINLIQDQTLTGYIHNKAQIIATTYKLNKDA
jgi:hypothetical protein